MVESFEVESVVRGKTVYEDVWSTAVEQHYLKFVNKKGSFFERTIWPIANLGKMLNGRNGKMSNGRKYSIFCCEFSYPCLLIHRKFLIHALCHCPFVHNGFYHWFYIIINSIRLGGQYGLC